MAATLDDEGRQRITEHSHLAERIGAARWRRAPWVDRDDMLAAASYGLCLASARWKRRCPFEMFAIQLIDLAVTNEVNRWRRGLLNAGQFADDGEYDVPEGPEDDEPLHDALASLTEWENLVLTWIVLRNETVADTADRLLCGRKAVCVALRKARRLMRGQDGRGRNRPSGLRYRRHAVATPA